MRAGLNFYTERERHSYEKGKRCQCPMRAGLHFYCTSLKASIYAGFRPIFSAHFSEYSDNSPNHGAKVGRGQIVLLRYNFEVILLVLL